MAAYGIGIVGFGKIAEDQHVPSIAETDAVVLAGVSSQRGRAPDGVPVVREPAELFAMPGIDAVAICTPPAARLEIAMAALDAGKHVLLEKPPAATLAEFSALVAHAERRQRVLFATWHSRFNAAVEETRRRLAGKRLRTLHIEWKEDVRRWHPGQEWVWDAGSFGVFDPGINALSILTRIMPAPVFVRSADLHYPENRGTPIAAFLRLATPGGGDLTADFDWRQEGEQSWNIAIETADGTRLDLTRGGAALAVDGVTVIDEEPREYRRIYARFADLLDAGESDVDAAPLRLVADAFLVGRHGLTARFDW
jgi:D-galactose 1-dehydrogenase